jgi:hypothetical protein
VECGEAYKLEADGPYCHIYFIDGKKKTVAKTLKKMLELNDNFFLRVNRKYAVNKIFIKKNDMQGVMMKNDIFFKFSRRRIMKKAMFVFLFLIDTNCFAQITPKDTTFKKVKVVNIGSNFFIEEITQSVVYKVLDSEYILQYDRLDNEFDELLELKNRIKDLEKNNQKKNEEKKELNKVLRQALKAGFNPNTNNLEDNKKLEKIKKNIEKSNN